MRRSSFLKSIATLVAAGALPLPALAATNVKMMIPANPGGGWDTTGRALGKAMQESGAADTVTYDNKGGAAGALGLAQFVNGAKGNKLRAAFSNNSEDISHIFTTRYSNDKAPYRTCPFIPTPSALFLKSTTLLSTGKWYLRYANTL